MNTYSRCWLDYENPYLKKGSYTIFREQIQKDIAFYAIDPSLENTETGRVLTKEVGNFFSRFFEYSLTKVPKSGNRTLSLGLFSWPEVQKLLEGVPLPKYPEAFMIRYVSPEKGLVVGAKDPKGLVYGVFRLFSLLQQGISYTTLTLIEEPRNPLRILNHWDNLDGSVERGYAGRSIFFENNKITDDTDRLTDYARLLASIGINGVVINNVNVKERAPFLLTGEYLPDLVRLAQLFRPYGVRLYLSVNFMSPVIVGGLDTADPLEERVQRWWQERAAVLYKAIPDFGGFLVKADSEYNPGPHTYGRSQSEGANMLARALRPHGGLLIWRAFVYKLQDWRDRTIDRARAAYDIFHPLDGDFDDNVILQIKNGPLDFQVREPVAPLFGTMEKTNQILELQITQEYTGHQIDLCYLAPQWQEILSFDPHIEGKPATVASIVSGSTWGRPHGGMAAVANIGRDANWTGHWLAQANWYAFGRLAWDPTLSAQTIAQEWVRRTLSNDESMVNRVVAILQKSWPVYEKYTTPYGLGWMVTPGTHYGPSPEGYEYSIWGTYHRATHTEIGVDRTSTGTGYTTQYRPYWRDRYDKRETCPEELILFFHRLPYTYVMKNGKTLIQNYYDAHFEGYEEMRALQEEWNRLEGSVDPVVFTEVQQRFVQQEENARQWRDVINSFFYRKSGIPDEKGRPIY
ncbi:alpha-glucuronidase [Treponema sp. J25]|uniref:alpha-glucuronidase n=1 Tax=Treponema sp. J25 TaxID=2094121 RepID=UPI001049C386|nr:alpha-glucuronidase [Treponema sp. J25]TCW62088.1 alpha-glucuronidase [Treponema sp. J25]